MTEGISRQARRLMRRYGMRRVPGFDPVINGRILAGMQEQIIEALGLGLSPADAEQEAWAQVARRLPPPRFERRAIRPIKASKSDCPVYRKAVTA